MAGETRAVLGGAGGPLGTGLLGTRLSVLNHERRPGVDRYRAPAHVWQDPVVCLEAIRGEDAAHVPALAVEELYVRVLCDYALGPRAGVRAVASRGDRGADELGTHRRRVRVAEVGL